MDATIVGEHDSEARSLRTSNYAIIADLPDDDDHLLLVHGYTGAYDRVSRNVGDYLRSRQVRPHPKPLYGEWNDAARSAVANAVQPCNEVMEILKRRGYLTAMTQPDEEAYFVNVVDKLHHIASRLLMPSYIVMPTYDCNLRCSYCFQDHMRTDPKFNHLLRFMTRDQIDRMFGAFEFIEAKHGVTEANQKRRSITLFGGEPLLAQSRKMIDYIMAKAEATGGATFSAVTNATELEHYADVLGPNGISILQITIDGPPEAHDRRRFRADGSGSFEATAANVSMALEKGAIVDLRMNVDRNNISDLPVLAELFDERGWTKFSNFRAYATPVHATTDNADKDSTYNSWELNQELDKLRHSHDSIRHISRPTDSLTDRIRAIFDTKRESLPDFKSAYCGAHNRMYIFDAFGDIYACWERTGDSRMAIGKIADDGTVVSNHVTTGEWRNRSVTSNPTCRQCRFALFCGGGCAILAEGVSGTMYSNYCDGFGNRFRASVAQAYQDHVSGAVKTGSETLELREL